MVIHKINPSLKMIKKKIKKKTVTKQIKTSYIVKNYCVIILELEIFLK